MAANYCANYELDFDSIFAGRQ